jgi:hypothetical protein
VPANELSTPDWSSLLGGSAEASWLADRDRKLGLILGLSEAVLQTARVLKQRGALFAPSADVLIDLPFAVDWYISLAGFALKTLGNIRETPSAYGVSLRPTTIRANLAARRRVAPNEVLAFAAWLKSEIESVWSPDQRTVERALVVVSAVLGGRAIGQGQNTGGSEAVLLLKSNISTYAEKMNLPLDIYLDNGWIPYAHGALSALAPSLRIAGRLVIFFPVGGNVPDVRFDSVQGGQLLGIGEVKGRKDLSNVWESWMPQVADHMLTWSSEFPDALRLFFGTLITHEMVIGESARGTGRTGLRGLHGSGHLQGVYNLSKLTLGEIHAWNSFDELMGYFMARC